jgi:hypothetical protein
MVSAVGGSGGYGISELMQFRRQFAAQQTGRSKATDGTTDTASTASSGDALATASGSSAANGLSGTSGNPFTSQLAEFLMKLQEFAGGSGTDGGSGSGTGNDPVGTLLNQAASNGTGISASDFEKGLGSNGTGSGGTARADRLFSKLDTNGDGTISQSEAETAIRNHDRQVRQGQVRQDMMGGPPPSEVGQDANGTDANGSAPTQAQGGVTGHHHRHHHAQAQNTAAQAGGTGAAMSSTTAAATPATTAATDQNDPFQSLMATYRNSGDRPLNSLMSTLMAQLQGQQSAA